MSQPFCVSFSQGSYSNTWKIEDLKTYYKALIQANGYPSSNSFETFFYEYMTAFLHCEPEAFVFDREGNSHLFKLNDNNQAEEQTDDFAKLRTVHRGAPSEIDFG